MYMYIMSIYIYYNMYIYTYIIVCIYICMYTHTHHFITMLSLDHGAPFCSLTSKVMEKYKPDQAQKPASWQQLQG